jgi:hypothetical protein
MMESPISRIEFQGSSEPKMGIGTNTDCALSSGMIAIVLVTALGFMGKRWQRSTTATHAVAQPQEQ